MTLLTASSPRSTRRSRQASTGSDQTPPRRGASCSSSCRRKLCEGACRSQAAQPKRKRSGENNQARNQSRFARCKYILEESFTTKDNKTLNLKLANTNLLLRVLFLLTNAGYFLAALSLFLDPAALAPSPLASPIGNVCASTTVNVLWLVSIGLASTCFHSTQCFCPRTSWGPPLAVKFNKVDLTCAKLYTIFLLVCFWKRQLVYAVPGIALLVLGGVAKLAGRNELYFVLHGLWHVVGALHFRATLCK